MKTLMAFLLLTASVPSQISPDACIVLAQSAEASAQAITEMADKSRGDKMLAVAPMLSSEGQAAAARLDKARTAVLQPMKDYAAAMTQFAKAMRNCASL